MHCEETRRRQTFTHLTRAQVMSLEEYGDSPRKLPIWTGARGHLRETWKAWRLAIAGDARRKGLYPLLRPDYTTPGVPTATTTADQRRAYETHQRSTQPLWFLVAQATRGQQQPSSHDASTTSTPTATAGKLGWSWNACMEDVHMTSGLRNYVHWNEDFEISSVTFMMKRDTI